MKTNTIIHLIAMSVNILGAVVNLALTGVFDPPVHLLLASWHIGWGTFSGILLARELSKQPINVPFIGHQVHATAHVEPTPEERKRVAEAFQRYILSSVDDHHPDDGVAHEPNGKEANP